MWFTRLTWHEFIVCGSHFWTRSHVWHGIRMCDMTRSHLWHDSFTCVTWLVHMCDMTRMYVVRTSGLVCMWHDIRICDMTRSHVRHVNVSRSHVFTRSHVCHVNVCGWHVRLVHLSDVTHSHVCGHDSFITGGYCSTLRDFCLHLSAVLRRKMGNLRMYLRLVCCVYLCGMTHFFAWHDSFSRVTWLIHMCEVTQSHAWHGSFTSAVLRRNMRNLLVYS